MDLLQALDTDNRLEMLPSVWKGEFRHHVQPGWRCPHVFGISNVTGPLYIDTQERSEALVHTHMLINEIQSVRWPVMLT